MKRSKHLRAFPNAYLETDEPPRRSPLEKIGALLGAFGPAFFGTTILLLSLFDGDYSPISLPASDYGVGRFALEMNLGFFMGGVGIIAFALVNLRQKDRERSKAASVLFFIAGAVLIMDSYFHTNLQGTQADTGAIIHGFGGFVFFVTAPIGTLLVLRKFGRNKTLLALVAFVVSFALVGANIGTGGLGERLVLLVIFFCIIIFSVRLYRRR